MPPAPTAAGQVDGCTLWTPIDNGTTCAAVLVNYDLTIDQFYQMNPTVKSDCSGLFLGTYYCVSTDPNGQPPDDSSGGNSTSTTATSATPTPSGIATPTPTQTGMVSDCNNFYDVEAGDGCYVSLAITPRLGRR